MAYETPRGLVRVILYVGLVVAAAILVAAMAGPCLGGDPPLRRLFDALWMVEASGRLEPPDGAAGEIGPYQVSRAYWIDARMPDGTWQDCRKKPYAERVMRRYWKRYKAKTNEQRARCHNSGWNWRKKYHLTNGYWEKVKKEMKP